MKRFIILLVLLVPFGALALILRTMVVEPSGGAQFEIVPLQVGEWQGREIIIGEATTSSLQATETLLRSYEHPDGSYITLFVAYFRDQKYGSQIHSPRHCLPGGGWVVANLERVPFNLGNKIITCNRMTIAKRSYVDQMFYWFETRSGELASEYALKFDLVKNSLLLSPTDAALVRLTVSQQNRSIADCQTAAEAFMQNCYGEIEEALPFSADKDGT
ncbi:MAG: EpsI family protein [candidate division Zixibacteria bacterium]|nr:EpsI family protein [candidate division Zixibacteria bacterium]